MMSLESVANDRLRHMLIGYARVSKTDGSQSLDLQRDALRAEGIDGAANLYHDVAAGVRWRSRAPGCGRRHAVGVAMVDHRGERPDPDPKPPVGRTLWRGVRRRCPHMGSRVGQLGYANWPDPASHRGELKPTSVGVEIRTHNIPTLIRDNGAISAAIETHFGAKPKVGVFHSLATIPALFHGLNDAGFAALVLSARSWKREGQGLHDPAAHPRDGGRHHPVIRNVGAVTSSPGAGYGWPPGWHWIDRSEGCPYA